MEVTKETKIKDLIPEGYEYSDMITFNHETQGQIVISYTKKQPKTLEYYERELRQKPTKKKMILHGYSVDTELFNIGTIADVIKDSFPKQYYSIILQMIADDICEEKMEFNWCMAFYCSGQVDYRNLINETKPQGTVLFDTLANVKKARDILGDNIKYLL